MSDRITLRGIRAFAYHGVLPEERQNGQPFLVDVTTFLDLAQAGASDRLESTLDYGTLARRIHDRVVGERWDLIERVAERVAELVLEHDRVEAVEVTVHKPEAPLGVEGEVSVTLRRQR